MENVVRKTSTQTTVTTEQHHEVIPGSKIIQLQKIADTGAICTSSAEKALKEFEDRFEITISIGGYKIEEVTVKLVANTVHIEGKHEEESGGQRYVARQFSRSFTLSSSVVSEKVTSTLKAGSVLVVTVPKDKSAPSGGSTDVNVRKESTVTTTGERTVQQSQTQYTTQQVTEEKSQITTSTQQGALLQGQDSVQELIKGVTDQHQKIVNQQNLGQDTAIQYQKVTDTQQTQTFVSPMFDQSLGDKTTTTEDLKEFDDHYEIQLDVSDYKAEEVVVRTVETTIIIEAKHQETMHGQTFIARQFSRQFTLPAISNPEKITSTLTNSGILTVKAPKETVKCVEGRQTTEVTQRVQQERTTTTEDQQTTQQKKEIQETTDTSDVGTIKEYDDRYEVKVDVGGYEPDEVIITTEDTTTINIEGKHQETKYGQTYIAKQFTKSFTFALDADVQKITKRFITKEILLITVSKKVTEQTVKKVTQTEVTQQKQTEVTQQKQTEVTQQKQPQPQSQPQSIKGAPQAPQQPQVPQEPEEQTAPEDLGKIKEFDDRYEVRVEIDDYELNELEITTQDTTVKIEGKHQETKFGQTYIAKQFTKSFTFCSDADVTTVTKRFISKRVLLITVRKKITTTTTKQTEVVQQRQVTQPETTTVQKKHSTQTTTTTTEIQEVESSPEEAPVTEEITKTTVETVEVENSTVSEPKDEKQPEKQMPHPEQKPQTPGKEPDQKPIKEAQKPESLPDSAVQKPQEVPVSSDQKPKEVPDIQSQKPQMMSQAPAEAPKTMPEAPEKQSEPQSQPIQIVQEPSPKQPQSQAQKPVTAQELPEKEPQKPESPVDQQTPVPPNVQQTQTAPEKANPEAQSPQPAANAGKSCQPAPNPDKSPKPGDHKPTSTDAPQPSEVVIEEQQVIEQEVTRQDHTQTLTQQQNLQQVTDTTTVAKPEAQPTDNEVGKIKELPDRYEVLIDVTGYEEEEITITTEETTVKISGKHQETKYGQTYIARQFNKTYTFPSDVDITKVSKTKKTRNIIIVTVMKKVDRDRTAKKTTVQTVTKETKVVKEGTTEPQETPGTTQKPNLQTTDVTTIQKLDHTTQKTTDTKVGQIQEHDDHYEVVVDITGYEPQEVTITTEETTVKVEAKHEETHQGQKYIARQCTKTFTFPYDADVTQITKTVQSKETIVIIVKKVVDKKQLDKAISRQLQSQSSVHITVQTETEEEESVDETEDTDEEIHEQDDVYEIQVNVGGYEPKEVTVTTEDTTIIVDAKRVETKHGTTYVSKQFTKSFTLPSDVVMEKITKIFSSTEILTITVPKTTAKKPKEVTQKKETTTTTTKTVKQVTKDTDKKQPVKKVSKDEDKERCEAVESILKEISECHNEILDKNYKGDKNSLVNHYEQVVKTNVTETESSPVPQPAKKPEGPDSLPKGLQEFPDRYEVQICIRGYETKEVTVKTVENTVIVEGKHEEKRGDRSFVTKQFTRSFTLPYNVNPQKVTTVTENEVMTITIMKETTQTKTVEMTRKTSITQDGSTRTTIEKITQSSDPVQELMVQMNQQQENIIQKHFKGDKDAMVKQCQEVVDKKYSNDPLMNAYTKNLTSQQKELVVSETEYQIHVNVSQFSSKDVRVKILNNCVLVEAKHVEADGLVSRQLTRKYQLTSDICHESVTSDMSTCGILIIKVPRRVHATNIERDVPIGMSGH